MEILCAPCATGEESYSIAIALLEAGVPPDKFNILGIDITSDALKKAQEASYKERSVRNLSVQTISRDFTKINARYILNSTVKVLVRFELANIFDETFKRIGKFDFVMSRNMLIYFDKETKLKAKEILESLRKDKNQEIGSVQDSVSASDNSLNCIIKCYCKPFYTCKFKESSSHSSKYIAN